MSFAQVLELLPELSIEERQILVRSVLELDDPALDAAEESLAQSRLAAHRANPASSVSLDEMKRRLKDHSTS